VLISTATVALQEQLVHKDLPALAAQMEQPFKFALAKGRGRYVCKLKLERLASGRGAGDDDDLFPRRPARAAPPAAGRPRRACSSTPAWRRPWPRAVGRRPRQPGHPPEPEAWSPVAAEALVHRASTARPSASAPTDQRKALVGAQVIVANHDLLLSSLGARAARAGQLPAGAGRGAPPARHRAGPVRLQMDLSRLTWIDRLSSRALRIGRWWRWRKSPTSPATRRSCASAARPGALVMDVRVARARHGCKVR
jgi:ATP-dependent DNA helicase DinG